MSNNNQAQLQITFHVNHMRMMMTKDGCLPGYYNASRGPRPLQGHGPHCGSHCLSAMGRL